MKKRVFFVLAVVFCFFIQTQVFAASKQDIMNLVNSNAYINGRTESIPDKYLKSVADFLNTDTYTQAELDHIYSTALQVKSIWENSGEAYFEHMPYETQQALLSLASSAAKSLGATLSYDGSVLFVESRTGRFFSAATVTGGGYSNWIDPKSNATGSVNTGTNANNTASNTGNNFNYTSTGRVIKATGMNMDFTNLYISVIALSSVLALSMVSSKKYLLNRGC